MSTKCPYQVTYNCENQEDFYMLYTKDFKYVGFWGIINIPYIEEKNGKIYVSNFQLMDLNSSDSSWQGTLVVE